MSVWLVLGLCVFVCVISFFLGMRYGDGLEADARNELMMLRDRVRNIEQNIARKL